MPARPVGAHPRPGCCSPNVCWDVRSFALVGAIATTLDTGEALAPRTAALTANGEAPAQDRASARRLPVSVRPLKQLQPLPVHIYWVHTLDRPPDHARRSRRRNATRTGVPVDRQSCFQLRNRPGEIINPSLQIARAVHGPGIPQSGRAHKHGSQRAQRRECPT